MTMVVRIFINHSRMHREPEHPMGIAVESKWLGVDHGNVWVYLHFDITSL